MNISCLLAIKKLFAVISKQPMRYNRPTSIFHILTILASFPNPLEQTSIMLVHVVVDSVTMHVRHYSIAKRLQNNSVIFIQGKLFIVKTKEC
jgi:hypothetical protein